MEENVFFFNKEIQDYPNIISNVNLEDLFEIKHTVKTMPCIAKPVNIDSPEKTLEITSDDIPISAPVSVKKRMLNDLQILNKFYANIKENEICARKYIENNLEDNDKKDLTQFINQAFPLNRSTWKIMKDLNVNQYKFSKQYVKIGNLKILLSGSKGGNVETINISPVKSKRADRGVQKLSPKTNLKNIRKKEKLLLNKPLLKPGFDFKPGPLCKKPLLNSSLEKVGSDKVEIVKLPSIAMTLYPQVGVNLEPVCHLLKQARHSNGFIDPTWANFAASVVQDTNSTEKQSSHTFVLPYQNKKSKVLAKKEPKSREFFNRKPTRNQKARPIRLDPESHLNYLHGYQCQDKVESDVKTILLDLLKTVHINEVQDSIYKIDPDDVFEIEDVEESSKVKLVTKIKPKKKRNLSELRKLDINIIDLDNEAQCNENCKNEFCKFGCICSSIQKNYVLNEHCGLSECMFKCDCELEEKYFNDDSNSGIELPNSVVANFQNQFNRNLSKEEKKFQRTVIRSNDQTIVLGARRRGVRLPKRYEDCSLLTAKELDEEMKKIALHSNVKVLLNKLPLRHCEQWCMVHSLYRCFCRGKILTGVSFSESISSDKHIFEITKKNGVDFMFPKNISVKCIKFNRDATQKIPQIDIVSKLVPKKSILCGSPNDIETKGNTIIKKQMLEKEYDSNVEITKKNLDNPSKKSKALLDTLIAIKQIKQQINEKESDIYFCSRTSYIKELVDRNIKKHMMYIKRNRILTKMEERGSEKDISDILNDDEMRDSSDVIIIEEKKGSGNKNRTQINSKITEKPQVTIDIANEKEDDEKLLKHINTEIENKSPKNNNSKGDVNFKINNKQCKESDIQLLENIKRKMAHVRNINDYKLVKTIEPPEEGKYIIIPYHILMANILLNKVFLWVTLGPVYRQFVTFKECREYDGQCINVMKAPKDLLQNYPDYIQHIHQKTSTNTFLFLVGKSTIWHIVACLSTKQILTDDALTISPVTNNIIPFSISKETEVIVKDATTYDEEISKNLIDKSQSNVSNVAKQWFIIHVGNDFEKIEVPGKHFSASYTSILKVIEVSKFSNKIINIPSLKSDIKFGAFAVPHSKRNIILLGPYKYNENPDINVEKKKELVPNRVKSWGVWLPPDNPLIVKLNAASTQECSNFTISSRPINSLSTTKSNETNAHDNQINFNFPKKNNTSSVTISKTNNPSNVNISKINNNSNVSISRRNISKPIISPKKMTTVMSDGCIKKITLLQNENDTGGFSFSISPRPNVSKRKRSLETSPSKKKKSTTNSPVGKKPNICDSDDDVIIIPNENPVCEISDSE